MHGASSLDAARGIVAAVVYGALLWALAMIVVLWN